MSCASTRVKRPLAASQRSVPTPLKVDGGENDMRKEIAQERLVVQASRLPRQMRRPHHNTPDSFLDTGKERDVPSTASLTPWSSPAPTEG
jgi:hypothetical protein